MKSEIGRRGFVRASLAAASLAGAPLAAGIPAVGRAATPALKIGFITTLSGPAGYLGEDIRDGFDLAVAEENGQLGGVPVKVRVEDDGLKPANALQIMRRMLRSEQIRLFTGVAFSNITEAIAPEIVDAGGWFLGPNTSPDNLQGKDCNPHYFVTGWDVTLHASAGVLANALGKKRLFLMAPNYIIGKEAVAAVKSTYKGQVAGEIYTGLDQTDFSAEIARIGAAKADSLYEFEPGGLGITFLKQFAAAGLKDRIPLVLAAPSIDPRILAAVGGAASGAHLAADWNSDFDNPANKRFVAGFRKAHNRLPTYYAAHGYDTARMIAAALKASDGKLDAAFGDAVRRADFDSVRGYFSFASNQAPVLNWYELDVVQGSGGNWELRTVREIRKHAGGAYAELCHMHV